MGSLPSLFGRDFLRYKYILWFGVFILVGIEVGKKRLKLWTPFGHRYGHQIRSKTTPF